MKWCIGQGGLNFECGMGKQLIAESKEFTPEIAEKRIGGKAISHRPTRTHTDIEPLAVYCWRQGLKPKFGI